MPATASSRFRLRYSAHNSGNGKAGLEALEHLAVQPPADATLVIALVEQRKAGLLQRRKVTADRARGDVEFIGKSRDRGAVPGRFQRVEHLPLANDFLVARHSSS